MKINGVEKKKKRAVVGMYKKSDNRIAYLMLLPNLILLAMFTIYPVLWALRYMFCEYDGISPAEFVGLENFVRIFTRDPAWWKSVWTTFVIAFGKLAIEIPLALVLAVFLNTKLKLRGLFRGIFFLPTVTSAAVMGLVFTFLFSSYNGIINVILMNWGVIAKPIAWLDGKTTATWVVIIASVWQIFGQNVILILAGLQNLPTDVYESAELDGANAFQKFFKITMPLLAPMLQLILMLAIIGSLMSFDTIYVLTGGGPNDATQTMGIAIYNKFFSGGDVIADYGYGATQAFVAACIVGILTLVYNLMSAKMKDADGQ